MPSLSTCPCCPSSGHPSGYEEEPEIPGLAPKELEFDESKHVQLGYPEVIKKLDRDMHYDTATVKSLPSDYGCCSAFRVMSEEGSRVIDKVLAAIDKHAMSSPRIPKVNRGVTFRNKFLNDLGHSPSILKLVSSLAGCELIYHPMRIQQLHTNLKPAPKATDCGKVVKPNVDRWHCDTTGFVLVLFCTDPDEYEGGELQYFNGTREEGVACFKSEAKTLPADRVLNVGRQHKGYGVFMQGCRIFHQVTPVTKGDHRTTMVFIFQPVNPLAVEAATHLSQTYNKMDPFQLFLPDWARFRAWKAMCRFDVWRNKNAGQVKSNTADYEPVTVTDCDGDVSSGASMTQAVVEACNSRLRKVVETLPYTSDRQTLCEPLIAAITELKTFLVEQGYLTKTATRDASTVAGGEQNADSSNDDGDDNNGDDDAKKKKQNIAYTPIEAKESAIISTYVDPYSVLNLTVKGKEVAENDLHGWGNLLGAVADMQSCVNDLLTIKENETTMEYF